MDTLNLLQSHDGHGDRQQEQHSTFQSYRCKEFELGVTIATRF